MKEKFKQIARTYKSFRRTIPDFEVEFAMNNGLSKHEIDDILIEIFGNINIQKTNFSEQEKTSTDLDALSLKEEKNYKYFDINDYIIITGNNAYVYNYPVLGDGWFETDFESKDITLDIWEEQHRNINIIDCTNGEEYRH